MKGEYFKIQIMFVSKFYSKFKIGFSGIKLEFKMFGQMSVNNLLRAIWGLAF